MQRYTISQFNDDFPDEDTCLGYIAALVYPTFPEMPCRTCGEMFKHHRLNGRKAYSCQKCGTQVYPLAGTIFEKSRTPLKSWFYAMYLMSTTRMGISAKQLERELGVTYKTAWRMFKQIRALMGDDSGPLSGVIEVDETWVGGKPRNRQPRKGARLSSDPTAKKPVVGMVERGGDVKPESTDGLGCAGCRARKGCFGGCGSGWWRWQGATVAVRACGQEETAVGRRSQACWRQAVERSARPSGVRSGAGSPAAGRGRR